MIESGHDTDTKSGRKIYSLYGETRKPEPEMFDGLDVLIIDLTDVGTRVYTFAQTMAYCMEAAGSAGIKVIVLDRPNPIGGAGVEGNLLSPDCVSFVGLYPLPMRHGMTMGEFSLFIADQLDSFDLDLEVVKMAGWERNQYFDQTGLPWVLPSPNMPSLDTAIVYPGQVIFEGTNISEGRGTTRPFNIFGAPFIDSFDLLSELAPLGLPGVVFRPCSFEPTFNKHHGKLCHGLEIHPVDRIAFKPYLTSLTIIEVLIRMHPDEFEWKQPPYEYEYERCPFDLIVGSKNIRKGLESGKRAKELESEWLADLDGFIKERRKYLLY